MRRTNDLPATVSDADELPKPGRPAVRPISLDLGKVIKRQFWLIACCVSVGVALSVAYWMQAERWYQSSAKILVNQGSRALAVPTPTGAPGKSEDIVDEDVIANHMEIIRSRRIIEAALTKHRSGATVLAELPSIVARLDEKTDAADYVTEHLDTKRGGQGSAKSARSMNIAFKHVDPKDAQLVLQAIVVEYEQFLGEQLRQVMSKADLLIKEAQSKIESELKEAQEEYIIARQDGPVLYHGEGSSNALQDKYRRLQDEMVDVEIKQSSLGTRLDRVKIALRDRTDLTTEADLELLALIDSDSLTRLSAFASLQSNTAQTAEFQAQQPQRLEEARAEITQLLTLQAEEQKARADFGPQHPEVIKLGQQIDLVKKFLEEKKPETALLSWGGQLSPKRLLEAYVGFLQHDLASLDERKKELFTLINEAEIEAKSLTAFELKDQILRAEIDRKKALFDGVVDQLRQLDTASGLSGYIQELLEAPRIGQEVWPDIKICGAGGLLLGLLAGLVLAVANDRMDDRFRSTADVEEAINLRVLGRVGKLSRGINSKVSAIVCDDQNSEGEVFRLIRTVLQGGVKSGRLRAISITSPMSGDGKSSITSNLGACFARSGISVLLVDADMRRPTEHRIFGGKTGPGLSDVLSGEAALEEVTQRTPYENLTLLSAGHPVARPAELLQSDEFDEFLVRAKEQAQLVLIDTGPVLSVSDSAIVAQKTDGMLLVVRPSNASREQAEDSATRLRGVGANLLGCVLNTFGSGSEFAGGGGYYGYYASPNENGAPRPRTSGSRNGTGPSKTETLAR